MERSARRAAIALMCWTQACTAYRPAPANVPLAIGRPVRIRAAEPFALGQSAIGFMSPTVCRATALRGYVMRTVGDTLLLGSAHDIAAAPELDGSTRRCPENQAVAIVLTPTIEITEQRTDRGRTTALIVGLVAALVGFAAYAASNIDPGFPPSGGGTSF